MPIIDVEVKFQGIVSVNVPEHLDKDDRKLLAQKIALCRILATTDNPDAPDDQAFDEYEEQCNNKLTAPDDWDITTLSVAGTWKTTNRIC